MKLPAVAIVVAFSGGIAFGYVPAIPNASHLTFLKICFAAALLYIAAGFVLALLGKNLLAAISAGLCWFALGLAGTLLALQPKPENYVVREIESGRLDIHSPLRWHGILRDEPTSMTGGIAYEMNLNRVEFAGGEQPVLGGMRAILPLPTTEGTPVILHQGDSVALLVQAKLPQLYRDAGAFDRRAYLQNQGIDLVANIRSPQFLELEQGGGSSAGRTIDIARNVLRKRLEMLFPDSPDVAAVLRAMLLGDRSFVDQQASVAFQKTGTFHVLVVAGLHVSAFAFVIFWLARRCHLGSGWTSLLVLVVLAAYLAVVEQRPPVLRAALMAAAVLLGMSFFRKLELLNSAALAALILLIARPQELLDSSFQLSFLAIGCIGGIAVPIFERKLQPWVRALHAWKDVTRDAAFEPKLAQFRLDLRAAIHSLMLHLPNSLRTLSANAVITTLRWTFRTIELVMLTLVLQFGMMPLMAGTFHRVSLSGPLANLLAVPLTGVIVPLGFLALLVSLISVPAAKVIAWPLSWAVHTLLAAVAWIAKFSIWSYRIPGPPLWLMTLFLALLALVCITLRLQRPNLRMPLIASSCLLAGAALLIAIHPFAPQWHQGKFELTTLDVGQGDSLFVVTPGGQTLLIDGGGRFSGFPGHEERGGPDPGEEAVSAYLWSRGYKTLDRVLLTHAHQDHLGGLSAVLENFHVRELWIGRESNSNGLRKLEVEATQRGVLIRHTVKPEEFNWDGVSERILWPDSSDSDGSRPPANNDSIVIRLSYGNTSFLLPGDAEKAVESTLVRLPDSSGLEANVLKIGHHGSKNSSTDEFLDAVRPQVAVISAGEENPYGHPSPELLERLNKHGIPYLRTDVSGAVTILSDGNYLETKCFVACKEFQPAPNSGDDHPPTNNEQQDQQ